MFNLKVSVCKGLKRRINRGQTFSQGQPLTMESEREARAVAADATHVPREGCRFPQIHIYIYAITYN